MSSAEIKLNIIRLIANHEDSDQLSRAYQKLLSILGPPQALEDSLFADLEESLRISLQQIENGEIHEHEDVMAKYRDRYLS